MLLYSLLLTVAFSTSSRQLKGGHDFQIFVRSHDGGEMNSFEIPSDGTVGDVIRMAQQAGMTQIQSLSFGEDRLEKSVKLADAGIGAEAVLHEVQVLKPRFRQRSEYGVSNMIFDGGNRVKISLDNCFCIDVIIDADNTQNNFDLRILKPGRRRDLLIEVIDNETGAASQGKTELFKAGDLLNLSVDRDRKTFKIVINGGGYYPEFDFADVGINPQRVAFRLHFGAKAQGAELEFVHS